MLSRVIRWFVMTGGYRGKKLSKPVDELLADAQKKNHLPRKLVGECTEDRVASTAMLREQIKRTDAVWVKMALLRMAEKRTVATDGFCRDLANLASELRFEFMGSEDCVAIEDEE